MRSIRIIKLLIFIVPACATHVLADESCELATPQWSKMDIQSIRLIRDDGEVIRLRSRIADNPHERSAGFQHICPQIIQLSSILFVYEQPTNARFHMFNVHDSLDIGFFDHERKLITVLRMTPQKVSDQSSVTYGIGSVKFMFALETRANFFDDHGLKPNKTVLDYP